ncbi:sodium:solute symporter family protein [Marinobacterium jannaschii]|uniref:sodium:solute symporter family protein n=1 Tax=Marinobacterium jannaschii TaxID=64970 RepID=UPI000685E9C8|nr:hypothetical protein [Marinobacterium jannaschii]
MFAPSTLIIVILCYMTLLFGIAHWSEKQVREQGLTLHPLVYALAFNVYSTSWAFYGAVGFATSAGLMFMAFDSGAIFGLMFALLIMRKMIRLKENFRITSIADLLSTRYDRSLGLAVVVTLIFLIGILPYIALQLKAVITTFALLTTDIQLAPDALQQRFIGGLVVVLMILFTVMFGVRRLDPTERHQGMMTALAVESLLKLMALLAIGFFVTFILYDGTDDLFSRLQPDQQQRLFSFSVDQPATVWLTSFLLGMMSVYLLPRQFHIAVVENSNEKHLPWLMAVMPLYAGLNKLFVLPLAAAGLVMALPLDQADSFVLLIPQRSGNEMLTLLVFIGGFSAATAMVIVSTMTLATMSTNYLLLPLLETFRPVAFLRRYLLQCRWVAVVLILLCSYLFSIILGQSQMLVALGSMSFVAISQLTPVMLGALYWPRGNRAGAFIGLSLGFLVWGYTLMLPALINLGWFSPSLLSEGPAAISWLRPQALFGLDGLPAVTHSLFCSLSLNLLGYLIGSFCFPASDSERSLALQFVRVQSTREAAESARPSGLREYIALAPKLIEAKTLLSIYLNPVKTAEVLNQLLEDLQIRHKKRLSMIELVEFHWMVEKVLAGSIGAAAAHHALETHIRYSEREAIELKIVYDHILSELQCTPEETAHFSGQRHRGNGDNKPDIERERQHQSEILQLQHRIDELEDKLDLERDRVFQQRIELQRLKTQKASLIEQLQAQHDKQQQDRWQ